MKIGYLNTIDYITILIFLLITLGIGLKAVKGIKSVRQYALADKKYGTFALTLTFLATIIGGGSTLEATSLIFSKGLIILFASFGIIINYLFTAICIAPKLVKFPEAISLGDLFEDFYGKPARLVASILGILLSLGVVVCQFFALGWICHSLMGIDPFWSIPIGGGMLALYSALGGIQAVASTDVFQFVILAIVIPTVSTLAVQNIGGYDAMFSAISFDKLFNLNGGNLAQHLVLFLLWCVPVEIIQPPIIQRMLMANDSRQLQNQFFISTSFVVAFRVTIAIIAIGALIAFPTISAHDALPHMIHHILPVGLKGFAISGLLAIVMSTADSHLHAAGFSFAYDILKPLNVLNQGSRTILSARLATCILGALAIFIAFQIKSIYNVFFFSFSLFSPPLTLPFIVGFLGLITHSRSFFLAMFATYLSIAVAYFFLDTYWIVLVAFLTNSIVFFISHFLMNGGIVWKDTTEKVDHGVEIKYRKDDKLLESSKGDSNENVPNFDIFRFIQKLPGRIMKFSQEKVALSGAPYTLFGIYFCISFVFPYFMWEHEVPEFFRIITFLRILGGILAALLLTKDNWSWRVKPFFPLFWLFTVMYCLPFINTVMCLYTNAAPIWLSNMGIMIFLLLLLVDIPTFVITLFLGVCGGLVFFFLSAGFEYFSFALRFNYLLVLHLIFLVIVGVLFAYRKNKFYKERIRRSKLLASVMGHDLKVNTTAMKGYAQMIDMGHQHHKIREIRSDSNANESFAISKSFYNIILETANLLHKSSDKTLHSISILMNTVKNDILTSDLEDQSIRYSVEGAIADYFFDQGQRENLSLELTDDFVARIPTEHFKHIIFNLLKNVYWHAGTTRVKIWIDAADHTLHVRDEGVGIPENYLSRIFDIFYSRGGSGNNGIGLAFVKLIVDSFYGVITCRSKQGEGSYTEFTIQFPPVQSSM